MIKWITNSLATASYYEKDAASAAEDVLLLDVRELVDRDGNSDARLRAHVHRVVQALRGGRRVLICCDKGISRSNAVALGALMELGSSYDQGMGTLSSKGVDISEINLALLRQVRSLSGAPLHRSQRISVSNVLITGATGYIGANLVDSLKQKFRLTLATRDQVDLAVDVMRLDDLVNKDQIDLIVHLAHPRTRHGCAALGDAIALQRNILEVCRLNEVPLVYLSGLVVYSGHRPAGVLKTGAELRPFPRGAYAEAKFFCEDLIDLYQRNYGVRATVLRAASVYGPKMPDWTIFSKFCVSAARGSEIRTHRYLNGPPVYDFLHVNDLVDAIELCISNQSHGVIHLGTGRATSTFELAQMIATEAGHCSTVVMVGIDDYTSKVVVEPDEARRTLGWEARVPFDQGVSELWREWQAVERAGDRRSTGQSARGSEPAP